MPESSREFRPDLAREFEYLLGHMPRVDRETFQGLLLENAEVSDRVLEAEHELLDAYVRGALPGEWRVAFEERFLETPEGRAKLAVARSLVKRSPPVKRGWWIFGAVAACIAVFAGYAVLGPGTASRDGSPGRPAEIAGIRTQTVELDAIARGSAVRPKIVFDANATHFDFKVKEPADSFDLSLVVAQRSIAKSTGPAPLRVDAKVLTPGIYLLTAFQNGAASNYYEFEAVR